MNETEKYLKQMQEHRIQSEIAAAERKEGEGEHCPNCDHQLVKPINDIWKDPMVKEALREGRPAHDIAVARCPECHRWGYYNEGSHFTCRFCERSWYVCSDDQVPRRGLDMQLDGHTTLADTVTETTDGYDNQTL